MLSDAHFPDEAQYLLATDWVELEDRGRKDNIQEQDGSDKSSFLFSRSCSLSFRYLNEILA